MQLTGAQILVQSLIEQGVDTAFGFPGGYVIDIFDALYDRQDELRLILPAHEQGGVHAADGYARLSGKTGVVIATSGPGATNLVTGIAAAFMDSSPLVAITGNVPLSPINMMGRDSFQEIDILGVTLPITKHSFLVTDVTELADTVKEAFTIANSGRPGPVLIDIPKNVSAEKCEYISPGRFSLRAGTPLSETKLNQVAKLLHNCERPLIFCGGGVVSSGANNAISDLASKLDIPVAASLMGLTALPSSHPLMLGMLGMHGTPAANFCGERCDLLLAAGTRFSDRVAGDRRRFAPNAKIIHIDADPSEFDKNVVCDLHIQGDAKDVAEALLPLVTPKQHTGWRAQISAEQDKNPLPESVASRYMAAIRDAAGEDAVIVTDVGQHQMWTAQSYPFSRPRSFITSGGLGAMGFGLGAAIGAKAAAQGRPVILVTGDGSFHMNLIELAAAVTENLPVIAVVMNNGVLGMVRQWQSLFYGGRHSSTTTGRKTDFVKIANAYGATGERTDSPEAFAGILRKSLASGKTCVIDCPIGPDEKVFPFIPPAGVARENNATGDEMK
jgi:acetolactate synthase-1/2/3 large subunit